MKHTCHTHTYTCKIMTQGTEPYGQVRRSKRTQGHIPKVRRTHTHLTQANPATQARVPPWFIFTEER